MKLFLLWVLLLSVVLADNTYQTAYITLVLDKDYKGGENYNKLIGLSREIWLKQLHVDLVIKNVYRGEDLEPSNWSKTAGYCGSGGSGGGGGKQTTIDAYYKLIRNYAYNKQGSGLFLFLSDCIGLNDGYSGVATQDAFCKRGAVAVSTFTPIVIAHELGHTFGALHTEEGIMSYGTGYLKKEKELGFSSLNIPQIKLNRPCLFPRNQTSICGNGIVEIGEDCECLKHPCRDCKNCKTIRSCSRISVINPGQGTITAVSRKHIAHRNCCTASGKLIKGTKCGKGSVCSERGTCQPICSLFGYTPCGYARNGCSYRCVINGNCTEIINNLTGENLSLLKNGAPCGKKSKGRCFQGVCSVDHK